MVQPDAQSTMTAYEHPLNERVRLLLRLECLFGQLDAASAAEDEFHGRWAVDVLVQILELMSRGDFRGELIKELDRLLNVLKPLQQAPGIAVERLQSTITDCSRLLEQLRGLPGSPGSRLKSDELLASIIQRSGLAGGTCGFDLPAYQYWLSRPARERTQRLQEWSAELSPIRESTDLIMFLIRESALPERQLARGGTYQENLNRNIQYQLIRAAVPCDQLHFCEISGSRHFITVRFMSQPDTSGRPEQVDDDVEFALYRCAI